MFQYWVVLAVDVVGLTQPAARRDRDIYTNTTLFIPNLSFNLACILFFWFVVRVAPTIVIFNIRFGATPDQAQLAEIPFLNVLLPSNSTS